MKHVFPAIVITVSVSLIFVFVHANTAVAVSPLTKAFGGTIVEMKAIPIRALESANFVCAVPGKTITIKPVGAYPVNYFIPAAVRSKTRFPLRIGQSILGNYSLATVPITCILKAEPPVVTSVQLHPITMFGTSK